MNNKRHKFEQWANRMSYLIDVDKTGRYLESVTRIAWSSWQACEARKDYFEPVAYQSRTIDSKEGPSEWLECTLNHFRYFSDPYYAGKIETRELFTEREEVKP